LANAPEITLSDLTISGRRWLVIILGLIEEEVGGKLFILVTCKVGLDSLIPVKA
jgi:hypothetical protein